MRRSKPMCIATSPSKSRLLIAATALVHNLTLVTHNVTDFTNVSGWTVVDWSVP